MLRMYDAPKPVVVEAPPMYEEVVKEEFEDLPPPSYSDDKDAPPQYDAQDQFAADKV